MKARLAWACGGFVLVALVVYRFLTRVPTPVAAPAAAAPCTGADSVAASPPAPAAAPPEPRPAAPSPTLSLAPEPDEPDELDEPDEPDERVEALRRKLDEARDGTPGEEPPLDDRRRSVHDAGRAAAETMRRTTLRSVPSEPAPAAPAGEPPAAAEPPGPGVV